MPTVYEVLQKLELAPKIRMIEISAPEVTKKAKPGQFVILKIDEDGERFPLMLADWEQNIGTITSRARPEFDGHLVNSDELIQRLRMHLSEEKRAAESHECKLGGIKNV